VSYRVEVPIGKGLATHPYRVLRPWMDLDRGLIRQHARGQLRPVPKPLIEMYPTSVLADVHADMRDLSCLGDESFDLVYGTGMCYIPDGRQVHSEVARVLRTGGLYQLDVANPATKSVDWNSWDGEGILPLLPSLRLRSCTEQLFFRWNCLTKSFAKWGMKWYDM